MVKFDKKGRVVTKEQQAAIHAKLRARGISIKQLSDKRLTTIHDDVIEARRKNEPVNEAIDKSLMKIFNLPPKAKEPPKVEKTAKISNALLDGTQRRQIQSGKEIKVIDVIRKASVTNAISHAEARRILESSNVIPPGLPDDAVLRPEKPIEKSLLKEDQKQAEQVKEALKTKEQLLKREIILGKQRAREEARGESPDEERLTKQQLEKADREANRKIVITAGDLTKERLEELERSEIARKNALISGRFQAGKRPEGAERKIQDAAIRKLVDRQEKTEKDQKILRKLGDLRDKRADKFQEFMKESSKEEVVGGIIIPQTPKPLTTPGLVTGIDPLKAKREETTGDKIRRRALDLQIIDGLSRQLAMDRAKREIVRQQLTT